jgi:very-short-patch-repair endonuclease
MKNVLQDLARRQEGVVATWQLLDAGLSPAAIKHRTAGLRELYDGVHVTGDAPITRRQRWWAAARTAPGTYVAFASAGAAWGFRPWEGRYEVVVRRGSGGQKRFGPLLVCRAKTIHATTLDGLPITTAERTLADLWRFLGDLQRRKALREALRLETLTIASLTEHLSAVNGRNRPASLTRLLERYRDLQLHRCRSDAEAYAVELIAAARLPLPDINRRIAGEEADLSWPSRRLIVEIDGDQFHADKTEDARKTSIWTAAGYRVERVPAQTVFVSPKLFVARVRELSR